MPCVRGRALRSSPHWSTKDSHALGRLALAARAGALSNVIVAAGDNAWPELPNRAQFRDRLQQAMARATRKEAVALLFLDVDHFKAVNDMFGHEKLDVSSWPDPAAPRGAAQAAGPRHLSLIRCPWHYA